jgi:hypothetical protein
MMCRPFGGAQSLPIRGLRKIAWERSGNSSWQNERRIRSNAGVVADTQQAFTSKLVGRVREHFAFLFFADMIAGTSPLHSSLRKNGEQNPRLRFTQPRSDRGFFPRHNCGSPLHSSLQEKPEVGIQGKDLHNRDA